MRKDLAQNESKAACMQIEYEYLPKQKTIVVDNKCSAQLIEAAEYIYDDSPRQAEILKEQFREAVKMIQRMPKIGATYKKGMRRIKLGKFRYYVYYKETKNAIEILGIHHTSRGTRF